jgi:hypothetical protein
MNIYVYVNTTVLKEDPDQGKDDQYLTRWPDERLPEATAKYETSPFGRI